MRLGRGQFPPPEPKGLRPPLPAKGPIRFPDPLPHGLAIVVAPEVKLSRASMHRA